MVCAEMCFDAICAVVNGVNITKRRGLKAGSPTMAAMSEPLILPIGGHRPQLDPQSWVAPNATLIGRVVLAAGSSVWYGAILRAEAELIEIGAGSNIQDGVTIHVDPGFPAWVGAGVTVGHNAVLHGCTVEDDSWSVWVRWCSTAPRSAPVR